ncbi:YbbR-like domain-containing protein [Oceanobacillus sp. Castelsardo]|uniref:CdaR family protein n=1 Tax=Oceanobacillus sp. Castelsardo TaxID=1851204 RepID=UPI0008388DF5|nr:CdaR family protein [Oceanobacillus sp. Castelsardo]
MDNWFKSKWFVRLVSLSFAVILYIFVNTTVNSTQSDSAVSSSNKETQTLDDVPVEIRLDDENYVVSGVPEFVTISLEGPPNYLRPIVLQRNFEVFVDLEGLEEGEHTVEIEHEVSNQLKMTIEPSEIDIYIEERAQEDFEVSIDFVNQDKLPVGYELGDYTINPSEVTITSSRNIIERIGVVKVFVDVAGVKEPIKNQEFPVNVYDIQGNVLNANVTPEKVKVSTEVNNPSKKVKLNMETKGELPEGYSLISMKPKIEEVEVFATSDILAGIESISTEEIDLSQITETGVIKVGLALPEGVIVPEVETIEVSIELEQTKILEDVPINVDGIDGQTVQFLKPKDKKMDVTLIGNEAEVGGITKDDIRLYANGSGLNKGQHNLPVEIEMEAESDDISISAELEQIQVNVE